MGTALPKSSTASGLIFAFGPTSWKKTLGTAMTICMCLDSGIRTKKMQIESIWAQYEATANESDTPYWATA